MKIGLNKRQNIQKNIEKDIDNAEKGCYTYSIVLKAMTKKVRSVSAFERVGGWCEPIEAVSMYPSLPS